MKLQQQVEKLIKPVEDSVRIYVLGADRREADDFLRFPATSRGRGDGLLRLFKDMWL